MAASATPRFQDVKKLLDDLIVAWEKKHGRAADLSVHGDPAFGWATKQQLAASQGFGNILVDASVVGNGKGGESNLVVALVTGVPGFPRMPAGGPFMSASDTATIVAWIDAGMPD